jgi:hypothetical protein
MTHPVDKMITNHLEMEILDHPGEAPKYDADWIMLKATKAIIVGRGTVTGSPTVDLQFETADGKKYVMMATGGIIEALGGATQGKRQRDIGIDASTPTTKQ